MSVSVCERETEREKEKDHSEFRDSDDLRYLSVCSTQRKCAGCKANFPLKMQNRTNISLEILCRQSLASVVTPLCSSPPV